MQNQSPLERLAATVGILPEYVDQTGTETRVTSDETRIDILALMGIDASTSNRAQEALEVLEARARSRLLAPVRVVRKTAADGSEVRLRIPCGISAGAKQPISWSLELVTENGGSERFEGVSEPERNGGVRLSLPETPPPGYHTVRVSARLGGAERSAEQSLIVVPDTCPSVGELARRDSVCGITANLYTVRSEDNWGIGDLSDLGALLEWAAEVGGAFVGINPLHALRNRGLDVSPYSPVSRVFRNAIYLDIAAIPELEGSPEAQRMLGSATLRDERDALRSSGRIEYKRVMALKRRVLEVLHGTFTARRATGAGERGREYRRYVESQGEPLELFATFEALTDHLGLDNWREWPEQYRDPHSPQVAAFQGEHAEAVDFHRWLQYELDRQLGAAAERGARAGLPIGVYQDLAIGTSPAGADIWANPHLFLSGVSIGAPPDDYSASGQNWGLPPLDPRALHEDAYRYWITLVRASLRHAGALRIDHAMGLFRQFWIPDGMEGKRGAYVRFPADDLLGILTLEARRNGALVVGEDLGTVPPEVPPTLHRHNILSSRVFYFEQGAHGFHAAAQYEPMALVTANTHDMPTLAGYWRGRDIEIKRELGIIESDEEAGERAAAREGERRAILERLAADGVLTEAREPSGDAELRGAIHAFLCRTPSAMVGLSLDDLVGEVEPVNVPGVSPERCSPWTRKLSVPIEALRRDPEVKAALGCERLDRRPAAG
jgi:4-alpha-glucanotransferase